MSIPQLATVTGPRAGAIHYVRVPVAGRAATCGKPEPRAGWLPSSDEQNNRNRAGFCERCMRKAPYL